MVDDQIKVTHDNNGRFYRIKMDLAKEGSEIWDLTPYFKARVGDNRFGLQVVWTYQGRLLDTTGMKPYIEGNVGNYSFDDKKDLQLAPDAATVRYTGNPSDCQSGGRATYYFPEQMFPRDGIFKGYIGLLDDRDDSSQPHISGVTVWFRVLPSIAQMGHACDVYISDLDKALQNFKVELDQHDQDYQTKLQQVIDDARNVYESETKNAHDAVIAAKAEADATRASQDSLNRLVNDTIEYIKAHNIVTLDKYNTLASQIVNRLGQMNFKPTWYPSEADMRNSNPNGTQDVCITADTGHKWVYFNGQWLDLGAFAFADIDPKLKESFLSNSDNIIPNPDFEDNALSWSFVNATGNANGNIIVSSDMQCKRVANLNAAENEEISFQSDLVPVNGQTVLSFKALTRYFHQPSSTGSAVIGFDVFDATGQQIDHVSQNVNLGINTTPIDAYHLSDLAANISFWAWLRGEGNLRVGVPHATFTAKTGAYTIQEAQATQSNPENVLINSDFRNGTGWEFTNITGKANGSIFQDNWADGANVISLNAANAETITAQSDSIPTNNNTFLSFSALTRYYHQPSSTGTTAIGVDFYDANNNQLDHIAYNNIVQGIGEAHLNGIKIPNGAVTFVFWAWLSGEGNLRFAKPQVTFTTNNGAYSVNDAIKISSNPDNALPNPDFRGATGWNFTGITGKANGSFFPDTWVNGCNVMSLSAANDETISAESDFIPVNGQSILSFKALIKYFHQPDSTGSATIGIDFFDANSNKTDHVAYNDISLDTSYPTMNNVHIPTDAVTYKFWVYLVGEGNIRVAKPQVTYASVNGTRDLSEIHNFSSPDNIIPNANFITQDGWQFVAINNADGYIDTHNSLNASNPVTLVSTNEDGRISFQTNFIPVYEHKVYSLGALTKCNSQGGTAVWGINYVDNKGQVVSKEVLTIVPSNEYIQNIRENIAIPDNISYIQVFVYIGGKVQIQFARPQLNFDKKLKPFWGEEQEEIPAIPVMKVNVANEIGDKWENGSFEFVKGITHSEGYLQIGIQGNSSRMFDKKNFKIKLYQDSDCKKKLELRPKSDWDKNSKFNLKANWVDFTQSRNLMGAKLVADAERVTPIADENIEQALGKSQNMGQMEGFPIELYINGEYHGMYTWNTKKDDKTFGMDSDNKAHEVISVGQKTPDHMFFADTGSVIDGKMWSTEIQDQVDPTVQVNFAKFIDWINQSSDADFVKDLHTYIDVKSVINAMLFGIYSNEYDYYCKSLLLATYDQGKSYYMLPYDMDSTWGDEFQGMIKNHSIYDDAFDVRHLDKAKFVTNNDTNLLFKRVLKLMFPEIQKQWQYLRQTVWTTEKVCAVYKEFIKSIPESEYGKDLNRWPDNPSAPDTSYSQIQAFILGRTRLMDDWLSTDNTTSPQSTTPTNGGTTTTTPAQPATTQAGGTTPTGTTPTTETAGTQTNSGTTSTQQTTQQAQPTEPKQ